MTKNSQNLLTLREWASFPNLSDPIIDRDIISLVTNNHQTEKFSSHDGQTTN